MIIKEGEGCMGKGTMNLYMRLLRAVLENNVQRGEPQRTFRRDWVVGVREKILHWVVGVKKKLGLTPLYVIFWNSPKS